MDIYRYELKEDNNQFTLLVYIDPGATEFGLELGHAPKKTKELQRQVRELVKEKFPHIPIGVAKIIVGSLIVTTLYLGGTAVLASAQTTTIQTSPTYRYDMYTVQAGDTLSLIAKRYNVTVTSIKSVNQLTSDTIYIGQQLKLPFFTYTVTSGDTLYGIAKSNNTTVDQIRTFNQLTTDTLRIGQSLKIPQTQLTTVTTAPVTQTETVTQTAPVQEAKTYTVASGDTLYAIAKRFNSTVSSIVELNKLTTTTLSIGQVLQIPQAGTVTTTTEPTGPSQTGSTTTQPTGPSQTGSTTTEPTGTSQTGSTTTQPTGETQPATATTLPEANATGQTESVNTTQPAPTGTTTPDQPATQPTGSTNSEQTVSNTQYTVVPGDTLYLISKKFNTTVSAIKTANNLAVDTIFIGQTLTIPMISQPVSDTSAPSAPALSPVGTITTENQTNVKIEGTAEANANVTIAISSGDNTLQTLQTKADETGHFEKVVDTTELIDGTLSITATATDQAGNRSNPTLFTIKKDTKTDSPAISLMEVINNKTAQAYPVEGMAEPGAAVQLTFSDGVQQVTSQNVLANERGEFRTFINLSTLKDGDIFITGKAVDGVGNASPVMKATITKDTTVLTTTVQELGTITSKNANAFAVRGTSEPNATIVIRVTDGVQQVLEKRVQSGATGEFDATLDVTALNDGTITITETTIDSAGNESTTTQTVSKDTFVASPVIDNRQEVTNKNANSYTLFGIADPGSSVKIVLSDGVHPEVTAEAIANEIGEFRTNVDIRDLNDGQITVTAQATDEHGNGSTAEQTTLTKETSLAPPVITSNVIINSQNASSYSVFGMAQPGTTVDISASDGIHPDILFSTVANENGEFHVNVDVSTLADTNITISAFQTSAAGITSNVANTIIEKDTTSPTAPIFHNNHFINQENQANYILSGEAEANAQLMIRIFNPNGQNIETTGKVNGNGQYSIPVDLTAINDGDVSFEITQIDEAGNGSPSITKTLIKDTVGPTALTLNTPLSIFSGNTNNYTLSGQAEPHITIDITLSDGTGTITDTVETDEQGAFSLPLDVSTLRDGEITVSFAATDNAGNVGQPESVTIVKDTTAPAEVVTTVPPFVNRQNQNNVSFKGSSVEEGATVSLLISDGKTEITKTAQVINGGFEAILDLSILEDGVLTYEVTQTDRAGNTSIVQASTIEKDTIVENPIASKNGFRYENLQYIFTVIGTVEANAQIEVSLFDVDGNELLTRLGTADDNGFYSLDMFVETTGKVASATVVQTDRAGNISEAASVSLSTYTVSSGDSLYAVAKRFNTTVDSLMSLNNLTSDVIQPDQTLRLPITANEVINLGYMYFGNTKEYVNTVNATGHSVNIVSPSYFDINADGTLKLTYQVDPSFITTMHRQGIRVVPFLSNHWNRDVGRALLQNKELAAQQIADAIARYNLDGVNVDIENVTDADRANYTEFVRLLRTKIPPTKEVSVAVAANPNGWTTGWHGSYDYTNLAKYADYLMVMSYDESYPGGDPGPVASASWVEKSVQYALGQNVAPDKIVLGIAHYGRYWIEGQTYGGFGISNAQIEQMIKTYNGTVVFDEISQSPKAIITIKPGDPITYVAGASLSPGTYTIWYENEESIQHKLELVDKYNLHGVGNWSLGQENPTVWNTYATTLPNTVPVLSPVYTERGTGDGSFASNTGTVQPTTAVSTGGTANTTTVMTNYTVVAGDSLFAVAARNNTTIAAIKTANSLTSDTIYVGQVLKIPTTVKVYTVVAGDTLSAIAARNNTTVTAIKTTNNLSTDTIYVGQILKIPNGA